MKFIANFFLVLYNKIFHKNQDSFITYKYQILQKYYGRNCLDIGAGYGHFSHFLHMNGHDVTSVDVTNKFQHNLKFHQFDGINIPLEDNAVDTSIFMFVLHHTNNQIELLKEASRVTKNYIIIGEDVMTSAIDKVFGNIHLNTSPWAKSDNLFHSNESWAKIFSNLNLEIIRMVKIPRHIYPIYPVNRSIFVLSPQKISNKR